MIYLEAYPDGLSVLLAKVQELSEEGACPLMVCVEIAGVDTDLVHHRDQGLGNLR